MESKIIGESNSTYYILSKPKGVGLYMNKKSGLTKEIILVTLERVLHLGTLKEKL